MNLIYSASKLQDFLDCERKFELKHLLRRECPAIISEPAHLVETRAELGRRFHFLTHQLFCGVPASAIFTQIKDDTLKSWFDAFLNFFPSLKGKPRFSEFLLLSRINNRSIITVFDFMQLSDNKFIQIFDWKTGPYLPSQKSAAKKIQTILYPIAVWISKENLFSHDGSRLQPLVKMCYWYPQFPDGTIEFVADQEKIQNNIDHIGQLIERIESTKIGAFRQTDNIKQCGYCLYRSICDRGKIAGKMEFKDSEDSGVFEVDFDQLTEISIEEGLHGMD